MEQRQLLAQVRCGSCRCNGNRIAGFERASGLQGQPLHRCHLVWPAVDDHASLPTHQLSNGGGFGFPLQQEGLGTALVRLPSLSHRLSAYACLYFCYTNSAKLPNCQSAKLHR